MLLAGLVLSFSHSVIDMPTMLGYLLCFALFSSAFPARYVVCAFSLSYACLIKYYLLARRVIAARLVCGRLRVHRNLSSFDRLSIF